VISTSVISDDLISGGRGQATDNLIHFDMANDIIKALFNQDLESLYWLVAILFRLLTVNRGGQESPLPTAQ
jgi:hypothetical protein